MVNSTAIASFDARYEDLARRWEHHQDLRRSGACVAELARSREELDAARDRLRG
ncbi:MAG: hypothetical protein R2707_00955 [Acidimicrobiales bacterium]